ncbi:hypothetical protein QZH41_019094 [Actinostola sp. cb2023]|nr:hypothetical protein QZH41_019094 [Actinostola sp. cb2023]
MLREGISSANMRKLRTAAGDKVSTDANEMTSILDQYAEETIPEEVVIKKKAVERKKKVVDVEVEEKREQLCILSVLGTIDQYTGIKMSLGDVKKLPSKDVDKYFNRYQTVLGNKITQGLVSSALELAVGLASYAIPIDNNKELCEDLKANEVLTQELNNIAGYFLLKGGRMVALSSCLVQVAKHVNFAPVVVSGIEGIDILDIEHGTATSIL